MKPKSRIIHNVFRIIHSCLVITSVLLVFLMSGCDIQNKKSQKNIFGFQDIEELKSIRLSTSEQLNKATSLYLFDSILFVYDRDREYQFKVIDIKNDKLISHFGKNGEGPCELTFPVSLNWLNSKKNQLSVNDRQRFRMETYDLNNILRSEKPACQNVTKKLNINYQLIAQIDSTRYVGTGLFEGKYALQFAGQEEVLESTIGFPKDELNRAANYQTMAMAYQGQFLKHPSQNKILSTSLYAFSFDILEITDENIIKLINRIHHWSPSFEGTSGENITAKMKPGNEFGCIDAAVSEDYIYILFSGKSNLLNDAKDSDLVFIYDWGGNPVKSLSLDNQISKIAVDQNDEILIGFINSRIPSLVRYTL